MGEHDLTWERLNDLMAENGRLDIEIDKLVDEKKELKALADAMADAIEGHSEDLHLTILAEKYREASRV